MSNALYAVYGVAGFGREVMPIARAQLRAQGDSSELVFIDDNPPARTMNGHRVLRYAEFLEKPAVQRFAALAIANGAIREKLAERLAADGVEPWSVRAANVWIMDSVEVGAGALLCPSVILTSNVRIGRFFHANLYSYVAHDCVIGDFVTFAPRVNCNGNITIEDHAYIGTGAILRQGRPSAPLVIGRGAVVGMGAVVTKSVPAGATVVGNPARVMA